MDRSADTPNAVGTEYLRTVRNRFAEVKATAERTFAQLTGDQFFWTPNAESNSISVIIQHMSGNMISRWTDFFDSDGEKPTRNRDEEFVMAEDTTCEALLARWNEGWSTFLGAVESLTEADLLRTVYIRKQPHTVMEAIERQMYHYSYHVGQIVYIAKMLKDADWQTLTIPRRR